MKGCELVSLTDRWSAIAKSSPAGVRAFQLHGVEEERLEAYLQLIEPSEVSLGMKSVSKVSVIENSAMSISTPPA